MKTKRPIPYITEPDELIAALEAVGISQAEFVADLRAINQRVSRQAVWKWKTGRTKTGLPGYVGLYFHSKYGLNKSNIKNYADTAR